MGSWVLLCVNLKVCCAGYGTQGSSYLQTYLAAWEAVQVGCGSDPGESVLLLGFPGSSSLGYWSRVGLLPSDSDQALSPVCAWL